MILVVWAKYFFLRNFAKIDNQDIRITKLMIEYMIKLSVHISQISQP